MSLLWLPILATCLGVSDLIDAPGTVLLRSPHVEFRRESGTRGLLCLNGRAVEELRFSWRRSGAKLSRVATNGRRIRTVSPGDQLCLKRVPRELLVVEHRAEVYWERLLYRQRVKTRARLLNLYDQGCQRHARSASR